ncbi:alpha/beta hydrolase [Staphylococcus massiliensis]|uniref:BD-FAE-like domain-containing protein n=2 Tax=Staphylococcus massiliensis TaxID=555791 RepID=K9ASH7_9STAP|nr:alpha/beta hydrolase [Staphylococcus massiliensis]EKU49011.1 hypothetical protein C273_04380 [Staphylococcus massiliensis S46]MCG3399454.1 alpha/beta hydrolase fold domain-containing protein [Staphylococcus massiliensis]MCG3411590.1 alpha/beta hydrolase fold domain-containing protein [Staphylococcus massiliensis]
MNSRVNTMSRSFGLLLILLIAAHQFLINKHLTLGIITIIVLQLGMYMMRGLMSKRVRNALILAIIFFTFTDVVWIVTNHIAFWVLSQVTLMFIAFGLLIFGLFIQKNERGKLRFVIEETSKGIVFAIVSLATILLFAGSFNSQIFSIVTQKIMGEKNYIQAEESISVINGKYKLISDVQYDSDKPRSYMDIMTKNGKVDPDRPTFFYIHGGGWVAGDKMEGDPHSETNDSNLLYQYKKMVDAGYNVVTINYPLAPQYHHPVQVQQVSDAISFLKDYGKGYGIGTDKIVMSGGSAGGQLAAEFVTIQANPEYAKMVKVKPVISLDNIKAQVLEVPMLDPVRNHKTDRENILNDYMFGQYFSAYVDQPLVVYRSKLNKKLNLIEYINEDFPPTFLSDGNFGSFSDQSKDYFVSLSQNDVKADIYIPDIDEGRAGHGFMGDIDSKETQTFTKKKLEFLNSIDSLNTKKNKQREEKRERAQ